MNTKKQRKGYTMKRPKYTDAKFYETPEFHELQTKWMKKLDDSGFVDAEDRQSPNEWMINWHDNRFAARYTPDMFNETREYFLAAADLLNKFNFKNGRDRKIWEMHSEGTPIRHIAKKLRITDWRARKLIESLQPRIKRIKK